MLSISGKVVSVSNKSAIVEVFRRSRHPLYGKFVSKTKRYQVHDLLGVEIGEEVEFVPTRPISKTKKWKISKRLNAKSGGDKKNDKKNNKVKIKK